MCVILLRVSGIAELSGPDPKMNDDGEGDDVWVELLSVQLVNPHGARFLGKKGQRMNKNHISISTWQLSFNHLLSMREINNPYHGAQIGHSGLLRIKCCQNWRANLTPLSRQRLTSNMSSADSQTTVSLSGVLRDQRKEL